MKIQLNNQETYEIRLDEEYSKQGFIHLIGRLINISQMSESQPLKKNLFCKECGKEGYLRRGWCLNCYRKHTGLSITRRTNQPKIITKEV